jgi:hypothetical protein
MNVGLMIPIDLDYSFEFGATCLPNLTRVSTVFPCLTKIIPDRPVNEFECYGRARSADPIDLIFFTRSTTPIQKIMINYSHFYPKSGRLLASIFPSLTHLHIDFALPDWIIVRGPDFFRI